MIYQYIKSPIDIDRLTLEIQQSAIVIALSSVTVLGAQADIDFKAELSSGDKTILDGIVASHTGEPLPSAEPSVKISEPVQVSEMPDPKPFAAPDYRTKLDGTPSITNIPAGQTVALDYVLPEERYVSGGTLIVKNAEFGDYVTAEIRDVLGVIPAPYRAAICENWPVVATYIVKEWVEAIGQTSVHQVDTYPLNAKINQGLVLRLTYTAANAGSTREAVVNYNLTKKL
jgi:hypothetical protein